MTVTLITDAGLGDSGKGRLGAYLAVTRDFRHVAAGGTGAGGAHVIRDGTTTVVCASVPVGVLNPRSELYIGPGTLVDHAGLARELTELASYRASDRLLVDFRCALIMPGAIEREAAAGLSRLGILVEPGATATRADLLWRRAVRAGDLESASFRVGDVVARLNTIALAEPVLVVGAHGPGYSLFKGDNYPMTASDDCSAAAILNRTGLAWRHLTEVIGVVNMVPTTTLAVPLPHELGTAEIDKRGWASRGVLSKLPRRVAERPSMTQIRGFVLQEQPTSLALGRMDLLCPQSSQARSADRLGPVARQWITRIERAAGVPVSFIGTGPGLHDVVELDADRR